MVTDGTEKLSKSPIDTFARRRGMMQKYENDELKMPFKCDGYIEKK